MNRRGAWLGLTLVGLCIWTLACMHPGAASRKLDRIDRRVERILAGQEEINDKLDELLDLARAQGTGEITLFYPWASSRLPQSEEERLIRFLDFLAHEAHGRTVLLVAHGVATDWRTDGWNDPLSIRRAATPRALVEQYLLHVPHRWVRIEGVGATSSPPGANGPTHRHVRIIAVYDESDLPASK